ncbi:MAG: M55 family metallopeptidase [Vicinamibacterales bacterium]
MKKLLLLPIVFLSAAVAAGPQAGALHAQPAPRGGPKVYVSVDMEGIWGVVASEQVSATSPEYGSARKWMAEDVNAVVAGLLRAGAAEIVVNDSHGSMRNIVADQIHPKVSLISGAPKPLSMMQGIDRTYDAVVFVGYHARAGSAPAILDHTISSATIRSIEVNGRELPELGLNAAIAGYYGVPVIMLSGDTETCAQAKQILGDSIVTAAVKEAITRVSARMFPAEAARARLQEAAAEALGKRTSIEPFQIAAPYAFEVDFNTSAQAELPMMLPGVKRTGPRSISFSSNDYIEGFKLLRAIIALAGA